MQDGYTQSGAGASDMRMAGKDLQHNRQTRTADEAHVPVRMVTQERTGGPMKQHLDQEMARHREARQMRLQDLEKAYKR